MSNVNVKMLNVKMLNVKMLNVKMLYDNASKISIYTRDHKIKKKKKAMYQITVTNLVRDTKLLQNFVVQYTKIIYNIELN